VVRVTSSVMRGVALGLTVLVMVAYHFLPAKSISIHPAEGNGYTIYSDGDWGGESSVRWLAEDRRHWRCDLIRSPAHPVCGLSVHWNDTEKQTLDASGYTRLRLTLKYQGPGHTLRVYIRNFNPRQGKLEDRDTHKFMSVNIPTAEFSSFEQTTVTEIMLTEFQVADWWREEFKVDRNNAKPLFDRVTSLGIDLPFPHVMGEHQFELVKAEFIGEWFPAEQLYLGIILTWLFILMAEAFYNAYRWRRVARENLKQVKDLTDYAQQLKVRSDRYRELSHVDNLTGIFNRLGFMQALKTLFREGRVSGCLIIMDIDYFKKINDQHGHIAGDKTLRATAQLIAANLRKGDIFARWGGEEFVLLVPGYDVEHASALAEKLRALVEGHPFAEADGLRVTISIGLTVFAKTDSLSTAFMRADEALYQAKSEGRNRVVFKSGELNR
jgi:diguanylate cyclase (GGDEF)-like protein